MIWWQSRPMRLRDEERRLIDTIAPNLSRRATQALLAQAEWREAAPGDVLTLEGRTIGGLIYVAEGDLDIIVAGNSVGLVNAGEFLGEITWEDGELATATAAVRSSVRYVWFDRRRLRRTLRQQEVPSLRAAGEHQPGPRAQTCPHHATRCGVGWWRRCSSRR